MESLLKKQNTGQLILVVLFIIYLIMGYKTPGPLADVVDTIYGKVIVVVLALILLIKCHPVLGVLALFVAFELIRRSRSDAVNQYIPSEGQKNGQFTAFNQFPYTLEQEMVSRMTTRDSQKVSLQPATFKPLLEHGFDAAPATGN
jgi:hypothetical protein